MTNFYKYVIFNKSQTRDGVCTRSKHMGILSRISELLRDKSKIVAAANAADLSYHQGVGKPEDHQPFGEQQPEIVAVNAAGLYALVEAIGLVAALNKNVTDEGYVAALAFFAKLGDQLPEGEHERTLVFMAMRFAHATWMAGQPFRGITTDPLGRVSRSVVMVFDELSEDEQVKDLRQIRAAAKWLCAELGVTV